ncbi:hypothetical protein NLG97_g2173 [Lecanicillium saksenae]|uniref:Uncharacterized protein n=1 Tax=Lecanicillium saksenae TaxID=468837 RepID=A0ACC1R1L5_9HYPO|nr:hypothetical protein NLG97_g2173 [Lecanicillium saksenae]
MHFSTLLVGGQALTLVKGSVLSNSRESSEGKLVQQRQERPAQDSNTLDSSLTQEATRSTVTETVTVVEITVSEDCSAPTYTAFTDKEKFVGSSTSLRTISPVPSTVVYNTSNTVSVETITTDTATIFSLPTLTSVEPQTSGVVNTDLGELGQPTTNPLLTGSIPTHSTLPTFSSTQSTSTVAPFPYPNTTSPDSGRNQTQPTDIDPIRKKWNSTDMEIGDIFSVPIDIKPLPRQFTSRPDHPVPRTGIQSKGALQTNKFYSNLFLGNQRDPVYTFPYSVSWVDGTGVSGSYGIACSHIEEKQRQYGPPKFDVAASYFINPIGIQSLIISARELGEGTKLTLDSMTSFSVRAHLSSKASSEPLVSFPLVQGMAYITAEYNGATPLIQTGVFFRNVTRSTQKPKKDVTKYTFLLEDGTTWRVYGYKTKGDDLDLQVLNNGVATSAKPFYGVVQVVKEATTSDAGEEGELLDKSAGIYAKTVELSGRVDGVTGSYNFDFGRGGHTDGELLMFALPHHAQSFDKETSQRQAKGGSLLTTTKGKAVLVQGSKWTMVEPAMPIELGFDPYHAEKGRLNILSKEVKQTINAAASKEILQDMIAATDLNSMYWSGKALAKFAFLLYVINDMLGDAKLAQTGLGQLKVAFAKFADNKQQYPLVHETAWGGVVSSGAYVTGQALEDYGNTYYNDHHFHYGYHILAAAVIGHLDKSWIPKNKDYVNMLARDTSNPSTKDSIFPVWRSFDWYHGHSWATGLFASLDGKNQESTSEDMMHAYGLKMWGQVTKNAPLEARSNLQLAVMKRSLQNYFLYQKDNKIQPEKFIGNKIESIQGIHMIPILPVTTVARGSKFVQEEWDAFFSNGRAEDIDNGWKSILLGNYATIAPREAFEVLSGKKFDSKWLDGGISLTWLLAYSAALGGL